MNIGIQIISILMISIPRVSILTIDIQGVLDYRDDRVQKKFPNNRNPNNCGTTYYHQNRNPDNGGIATIDGIVLYCEITVIKIPIIEDPCTYLDKY